MADERTEEPAPKSSDDLIREARRASAQDRPGSGASEDLLNEARSWIEGGRMEPSEGTPVLAPPPATSGLEIDEEAIEAEVARTLRAGTSARPTDRPTAQPATRPSRRRARFPIPVEPSGTAPTGRQWGSSGSTRFVRAAHPSGAGSNG